MAQLEELFKEGKREEAHTLSAQIKAQSESLQEQEMDLAERTSKHIQNEKIDAIRQEQMRKANLEHQQAE